MAKGIFKHQCIQTGCDKVVMFDDEPWCFEHSPNEGSSLPGWSARKALFISATENVMAQEVSKSNIFASKENSGTT